MNDDKSSNYFELSFRPNISLVSVVRRFVSEFYDRVGGDAQAVSRMALASHELLENAIRYARDRETAMRVDFYPDTRKVQIQTRNRAEPEDVEYVAELLRQIREASDPMALYQERMLHAAQRTDGGSGLGLVRIYAEADFYAVRHRLEGDMLVIEVEGSLEGAKHD